MLLCWIDMHKILPVGGTRGSSRLEHQSQADLCQCTREEDSWKTCFDMSTLKTKYCPGHQIILSCMKVCLIYKYVAHYMYNYTKNIAYCNYIRWKWLQFRIIYSKIFVILTICAVLIFNEHSHYTVEQQMKEENKACMWSNQVDEESQMVSVHYTQA